MTKIQKTMRDSAAARWGVLLLVSVTMMFAYFVTDVMAPLEKLILASTSDGGLGWTASEYGIFTGGYGWFNVFFFMLFIGGIVLDKLGVRLTGALACILMMVGAFIKFYAVSDYYVVDSSTIFGIKSQVFIAGAGFGIFGMGAEICGITVTKAIVKWFTGKEMALAMGVQVAMARIGTATALAFSADIAEAMGGLSTPVLFGACGLSIGLLMFLTYSVMDFRLDKEARNAGIASDEDSFKLSDIKVVLRSKGFWMIAFLCLMFYSGVFPFLKYATNMMESKYGVSAEWAGKIPGLLPFGTILLTPIFGTLYDKIGKGATIMISGSALLLVVHILFALPGIDAPWFAVVNMILLGIAFSLVPSALWPSVPKIIPQKQLGTAYALIFYVQNIGLMSVPMLIGWVIGAFAEDVSNLGPGDYVIPMGIFAAFGVVAVLLSMSLKSMDKKYQYGLEKPNQTK
ncbi:MAG: MFS transporter [Rikenellaceae bacterium]